MTASALPPSWPGAQQRDKYNSGLSITPREGSSEAPTPFLKDISPAQLPLRALTSSGLLFPAPQQKHHGAVQVQVSLPPGSQLTRRTETSPGTKILTSETGPVLISPVTWELLAPPRKVKLH